MAKINKEALIDYWNLVQTYACQGGKKREGLSDGDMRKIYKNPREKNIYEKGYYIVDNIFISAVKKFQKIVSHTELLSGGSAGTLFWSLKPELYNSAYYENYESYLVLQRYRTNHVALNALRRKPTKKEIDQLKDYILAPFLSSGIPMEREEWSFLYALHTARSGKEIDVVASAEAYGDGYLKYTPPVCTDKPRFVEKANGMVSSNTPTPDVKAPNLNPVKGEEAAISVDGRIIFVPYNLIETIINYNKSIEQRLQMIRGSIQKINPKPVTDVELIRMMNFSRENFYLLKS